jgi:MOSC domain-containing protein YiiM
MQIVSVNVGLPREVPWRGERVRTGIFKDPVAGRIPLRRLNLDGDGQGDLSVHGGVDKAVYAYPSEHYPYWREQLDGRELPWGAFGENLSTEGLLEGSACIGDEYLVGTARLAVTQPRMPCYKLGLRFDDPGMVRRFLASGRPGIYFRVLDEGEIGPGDPIRLLHRGPHGIAVTEMLRVIVRDKDDAGTMRRLLDVPALAECWREEFGRRLGMIAPG